MAEFAANHTNGRRRLRRAFNHGHASSTLKYLDLRGRHKQLYDLRSFNLGVDQGPLRYARNFLDTFRDVYRLESSDINTLVGVSGPAFPINASHRLWEKYELGERSKIVAPATMTPA